MYMCAAIYFGVQGHHRYERLLAPALGSGPGTITVAIQFTLKL